MGRGGEKMATEKQLSAISAIVRALRKIEGVASGLERKYSTPLLDAVERIEFAIKEITDENEKAADFP